MSRPGEDRIEGNRNFANKIWNAARFLLINSSADPAVYLEAPRPNPESLPLAGRWILIRLQRTIESVNRELEAYRFDEASRVLYQFLWHEFCDWYLEFIKPTLYGTDTDAADRTRTVSFQVFESTLRLLHPFMPFITEEIWQTLHRSSNYSIVRAPYPTAVVATNLEDGWENLMNDIVTIITEIRRIRNELNINPSLQLKAELRTPTADRAESLLREGGDHIRRIARLSEFEANSSASGGPSSISGMTSAGPIFINLDDVDPEALEKERSRLKKNVDAVASELSRLEEKLNKPTFVDKAPPEVVSDHRLRRNDLSQRSMALSERLKLIEDVLKGRKK